MASADSDGELLRRVAERDAHAFELLYRRYARSVYGLALRRVGASDGAEDATRRAFAAIRRSAAGFAPGAADGARWVFTVAAEAIAGGQPLEADWPAFRVHAALARLPEQERVSLERVYWGDRTRGDSAEARAALQRLAAALDRGA
jgi:DNA-directed RNA polymerase specialized sigma24 family protein